MKGFYPKFSGLAFAKADRIWFRICKGQINTVAGFLLVSRLVSANPVRNCPHNKPADRIDAFILSVHPQSPPPPFQFFAYSYLVCFKQTAHQCCRWNCPLCTQKKPASQLCSIYEGHLESKERFAIKKYLLIIGKKKNMQVLSHTFTYFST